jgi:hypothetical protein
LKVKTLEALIAKSNEEKLSDQIMRENYMGNTKRKQSVMKVISTADIILGLFLSPQTSPKVLPDLSNISMTYSFLQVALEEEKDKVEESRRLHEADKKLICELRYEVEQLQIELEVRRQDLIAQKETMNAERNRSENERKETDRLEAERKEELRIKTEENLRIQNEQKNEQKKVERSETFSEFYSENVRIKKAQDEQQEQEKKNEIFLKQQQILLDETVRMLSVTTIGKSQDARITEVDVNLAGQIRYIQSTFCTFHRVLSILVCAN